jgi:aarF domain-containing kinase
LLTRQVAKEELALECDYTYEARCQQRFKALIEAEPAFAGRFSVPAVVPELCAQRLLTTERVPGVHIDQVRLCEACLCCSQHLLVPWCR